MFVMKEGMIYSAKLKIRILVAIASVCLLCLFTTCTNEQGTNELELKPSVKFDLDSIKISSI